MALLAACAAAPFFDPGRAFGAPRLLGSETCTASVYWEGFGRPLADGRRHRPDEVLAAHKSLPFGTIVRITVIATGHSEIIPIVDRGPYVRGRCIDLSRGAARALGVSGLARVSVEPVSFSSRLPAPPKALGAAFPEANQR